VANEGTVYRPYLVRRIVDSDGKTLKEYKPEVIGRTGIPAENFRLVKQGLFSVVNDPGGTGGAARLYDVRVAGKTGTSQVVKMRDSKRETQYQFRDHALFVAFAPYDKPEIAIAVIVEHGEHGGSAAGPIAGRMLRAYFDAKKPAPKPAATNAGSEDDDSEDEELSPPQKPFTRGDRPND
jgi:penicillin-binding protein 2